MPIYIEAAHQIDLRREIAKLRNVGLRRQSCFFLIPNDGNFLPEFEISRVLHTSDDVVDTVYGISRFFGSGQIDHVTSQTLTQSLVPERFHRVLNCTRNYLTC